MILLPTVLLTKIVFALMYQLILISTIFFILGGGISFGGGYYVGKHYDALPFNIEKISPDQKGNQ